MEIRTLRYFLTIAQEKTIVQAAKKLHITQPTLSRQMKELEEEFDKQLFIRTNRTIILTDDGLLLKKQAQQILFLVDKTEEMMKSSPDILSGDIHIGATETAASSILAKAIAAIQKDHPQIHFHLYSGNVQDIADRLESGLLDFGLVLDPVNLAKFDFFKLPIHDRWGLLVKDDNRLAAQNHVQSHEIYNMEVMCPDQEMVKNEFAGWLGGNYRGFLISNTYNLLYNAAQIVAQGGSLALSLESHSHQLNIPGLSFVPFHPDLNTNHYLIYKKYQLFSKECEHFLNVFQQTATGLNEENS
ncbi:MAG: LysR family transcriptional regulator [Erysipelotrichaceae bacterium]|nr:LysR family transcriptional regulator [Erysipelotrichaceae bacterium]MDD3809193.1 LysR family transcriptional regulator [Erysipelotrichaceae bacterium]